MANAKEFELFNMKTGAVFKKIVSPMHAAIKFEEKLRYSNKLMVLSSREVYSLK